MLVVAMSGAYDRALAAKKAPNPRIFTALRGCEGLRLPPPVCLAPSLRGEDIASGIP